MSEEKEEVALVSDGLGEEVRSIVEERAKEEEKRSREEFTLSDFDLHDSMIQIEMLFQSHILSFGYKEYTLENYADRRCFAEWKAREGCRDTDEMRAGLNIDGILRSGTPSEGEALTYLQYVLNIAELSRRCFNRADEEGYDFDIRNYTQLLSRIREMLKNLRYDYRYVEAKEFIFIVPHDEAADAAIPDIPSDPVYGALTEYRSTSCTGNLARKRALLTQLGQTVEAYPDNLKNGNNLLYSRLEFLLNNVHIRNDNCDGEERIERVARMSPDELEDWYDETYRMLIIRILSHENLDRMKRIDRLAGECGTAIETVTAEEIASILSGLAAEERRKEEAEEREEARMVRPEAQLIEEEPDGRERKSDGHVFVKVAAAVVIADVLFLLFLMYYFHLI